MPSFASPGNSNRQTAQSGNDTVPEVALPPPTVSTQAQTPRAPLPQSTARSVGATTYGIGDATTVTFGGTASQAGVPAGTPQDLSSGNDVVGSLTNAVRSEPAEDEPVPISSLTRTNFVVPIYPRAAQRRNITGSVDVMFTVSTIGTVIDISVLTAEPEDTFNRAAMNAVAKWRFEPVIVNGVAVERTTAVRLAFNLQ